MRRIGAPTPPVIDATLGAGDIFDVRVYDEVHLSGSYQVDPQGTIDYPLVGRIKVAGLRASDVAELLRSKLEAFVKKPQLSVFVRDMMSKKIVVYGQVAKPGTYPYASAMTISQLISLAGGFTNMAARERVTISRFASNERHIIEVDLRAIADGKAVNQFVEPGDEVYVPERLF